VKGGPGRGAQGGGHRTGGTDGVGGDGVKRGGGKGRQGGVGAAPAAAAAAAGPCWQPVTVRLTHSDVTLYSRRSAGVLGGWGGDGGLEVSHDSQARNQQEE
jgi:hypothetical protein